MQFSSLIAQARPYREKLALIVLLSLLVSLASLLIPWLAAQLLSGVIEPGSAKLNLVVSLLVVALLATTFLTITRSLVSATVAARILADFRKQVYGHLQDLPLRFHDQSHQGDLLTLMSWDVSRLASFVSHWLASALSAIFTAVGALFILYRIDPRLALVLPFFISVFYIAMKLIGRRLRTISSRTRDAEARVMAKAEQSLEMLPAIKAFAREERQQEDYAQDVEVARENGVKQARIYAILRPVNQLVAGLVVIGLLLLFSPGGFVGSDSTMNTVELFSFLLYAALLTRPIATLADLYGEFNGAQGSLARLQQVLNELPEPGYQAPNRLSSSRGEIAFRDIWFSYPGRGETLRGANLEIRAGEIVALTGENGAGKTTLIRILLGLYLPQRGKVFLDGIDIAQIQVQDLRRQIGYVPQRTLLFNGTIRDNIGWGLEGASDRDMERAARIAQALDFISTLPKGFDTMIGDRGVRLSGGQQQRVALARALLKDPPILILDEATSMYDLEGEADFVDACKTALLGRTVIIITHRPASLALADRIIKVDGRSLIETTSKSSVIEGAAK